MPIGLGVALGIGGGKPATSSGAPPAASGDPNELAYSGGDPASGTNYVVSVAPVLHFDASRITGLSNGDAVASWPDRSGNGYNATQTSAANKPTYRASGQNSKPYLEWDGSNDVLDIASGGGISDDFTLVVAGKRDSTSSIYIPISTDDSTYQYYFNYHSNDVLYPFGAYATSSKFSNDLTSFDFAWLMRDTSNVAKMYERDGGTQVDSRTWSTVSTLDYNKLGARKAGGFYTDGDIYEIIIFNSQLSTTDLNVVLDYLDNKYHATSGGNSHTNFS